MSISPLPPPTGPYVVARTKEKTSLVLQTTHWKKFKDWERPDVSGISLLPLRSVLLLRLEWEKTRP